MSDERAHVAAIMAHSLFGSRLELPEVPFDDEEWERLLQRVEVERVPGLLAQAIDEDALPATEQQRRDALQAHTDSMCLALILEKQLVALVEALVAAGIDYRVLKGSAVAHLDYHDPSMRSFGDVDLLVPGDDYDRALALLSRLGCERQYPEPRPGFDRRFGKGVSLQARGYEVDLHRTFVAGPFAQLITPEDLFATSSTFDIGGWSLLALAPEERFLHACFHALLGDAPPRLVPLLDVVQILLSTPLDLDKVRHLCASWRAEAVMARAISLAWRTFDLADRKSTRLNSSHSH